MVPLPDRMTALSPWTLRADGLEVRMGRRRIVGALTWEHRPGTIAWLVGENGAGKSSLLRVLAGRARPAAGRVRRDGPPGALARTVYYHPEMRPPPGSAVGDWERLFSVLLPADPVPPSIAALAPATVQPDRWIGRLSTGEARRLLLGAILRIAAPFLFLDEPFAHLSAAAGETLTDALIERARSGVVVVATNRPVPPRGDGPILRLDGDRLELATARGGIA